MGSIRRGPANPERRRDVVIRVPTAQMAMSAPAPMVWITPSGPLPASMIPTGDLEWLEAALAQLDAVRAQHPVDIRKISARQARQNLEQAIDRVLSWEPCPLPKNLRRQDLANGLGTSEHTISRYLRSARWKMTPHIKDIYAARFQQLGR